MHTTERFVQRIGTTEEKDYIVVTVEFRTQPGEWQTTEHETVNDPVTLSIMGERIPYRSRNAIAGGQITDDLADVIKPAPGWTLDEVNELRTIWDRWHLNTMRAGCVHQTVVWEDSRYGRRPSLELTEQCPESGYRYGHAWLTEPLPAEVVERVRHLMRDRSTRLYAERGYDALGRPVNA